MERLQPSVEIVSTPDGWSVVGEVDVSNAATVAAEFTTLPTMSQSNGRVVLDMSAVTFIDSSGLRVLIDLAERSREAGAGVVIASPSRPVARLLAVTGVGELFTVDEP